MKTCCTISSGTSKATPGPAPIGSSQSGADSPLIRRLSALPTGQPLAEAIERVERESDGHPAYYMINCAHPDHFDAVLTSGAPFVARIRGLRANALRMSHAELNEAPTLDVGDPAELGAQYAALRRRLPQLNVMGGCCGTDHRHVDQIAAARKPLFL